MGLVITDYEVIEPEAEDEVDEERFIYTEENEEFEVTIDVLNDGPAQEFLGRIELNGAVVEEEHQPLDFGESHQFHLTWQPTEEDHGSYPVNLGDGEGYPEGVFFYVYGVQADTNYFIEEQSWILTITDEPEEEEPFFDVTITNTNSPITEGDDLDVDVHIENTGEAEGTQDIKLYDEGWDDQERDSKSVTLSDGSSTTETLTWSTSVGDGEKTDDVRVESDDDADTETVTIEYIQYTLTVNVEGEGTTTPSEGTHDYDRTTEVTVTADPAEGWEFDEWTGDGTTENGDRVVNMDDDKSVTAWFTEILEGYLEYEGKRLVSNGKKMWYEE